ncbi:hypothetical protein D1007_45706 [Hordeum vulgare]|nr:hypothetical protein D1007_45706 [Hordeum vulgare]
MHIRWKTMRVNSEQRWLAYKDTVAESLDKALELFAIKTNVPNLLDLNRVASSIVEAIPAPINEEANIEPLSCVDEANEEVNIEHEPLVEANDEPLGVDRLKSCTNGRSPVISMYGVYRSSYCITDDAHETGSSRA